MFGYLEEILDVLTAIESGNVSRELKQILGALPSFLNYRVIKTTCSCMDRKIHTHIRVISQLIVVLTDHVITLNCL